MKMRRAAIHRRWLVIALALALSLAACGNGGEDDGAATDQDPTAAEEDDTEEEDGSLYEGEELNLVVTYGPGGGFDTLVRAVAPAWERELGLSNTVVENTEGAGGLLALNELAARSDPDGSRVVLANYSGMLSAVIAGSDAVEFDPADLTVVGQAETAPTGILVNADSEYETLEDLVNATETVRFGSTGPGAIQHFTSTVMGEELDLNYEVVTGYEGTSEIELSLARGEIDVVVVSPDPGPVFANVESGDLRLLGFLSPEPVEGAEDMPLVQDLAPDDEAQEMLQLNADLQSLFRVWVTSPDIESERLEELRAAWRRITEDPEANEQALDTGAALTYLSPEDVKSARDSLLDAPPRFVELAEEAFN